MTRPCRKTQLLTDWCASIYHGRPSFILIILPVGLVPALEDCDREQAAGAREHCAVFEQVRLAPEEARERGEAEPPHAVVQAPERLQDGLAVCVPVWLGSWFVR